MLYWMAALQGVPEDLYEAAQMDRANAWQQFTRITLPMIAPMAVVGGLITLALSPATAMRGDVDVRELSAAE